MWWWIFSVVGVAIGLAFLLLSPNFEGIKLFALASTIGIVLNIMAPFVYEQASKPLDYGIPDCPADGVRHYEVNLSWKEEASIRHEYQAKGWTNLQVTSQPDGGFLGGRTDYMTADCPEA